MKLIFALLSFFSVQAFAVTVYVNDVKTSNSDPNLASSVKSLVVSSANSAGASVVQDAGNADYVLQPELIQLGQAYVLTVAKMRGGKIVFASRQKAATTAELDDAADRAVRAALVGTPSKKDMRVGEVQEKDKDVIKNRVLSKNSTYLGFGAGGFSNAGYTPGLSYNLALGYTWETTARAAIRVLAGTMMAPDFKSYYMDGLLGLNLYLTDEDSSPYLFGGLGFGGFGTVSSSSTATTVGGFGGALGLGYTMFRTSSTEFDLCLETHMLFANNTVGNPGTYEFRIGVLF